MRPDLACSAITPRTAMALMRPSDIQLTTNIYQHLKLVDTAGAVTFYSEGLGEAQPA